MRYVALAADYDGTLAHDGRVDPATVAGLERLLASGRKLILVTGRELDELLAIFPHVTLFERVVAENGAALYRPATKDITLLAPPPPPEFVNELRARGVAPMSVGRSIVATWHPHETVVLEVIRDLGLEMRVIFNKGAVMVLHAGVTKASGLQAALDELALSPHNVVGIGDAENDHALLRLCEYGVAVQNAIPMLKETADRVTAADHGAGVVEIIDELIADDLRERDHVLTRHHILLGKREGGEDVTISPYRKNVLLAGSSGSGKSTLATGLMERLAERHYRFCLIDPEGDYEGFDDAIALGNAQHVPTVAEILQVLEKPDANAVINLVGLPLQDRPGFFVGLLPRLQELRATKGRPHWIVVDETHHLLPAGWDPAPLTWSRDVSGMVFITVHPDQVAPAVLGSVDMAIVVGEAPDQTLRAFWEAAKHPSPSIAPSTLQSGEALVWVREQSDAPFTLKIEPSKMDRRRHRRKYAEGVLPPDRSFYFRGPSGVLNLRAQNLVLFMQMADGVDDATWLHHLKQGDYSSWFREKIKDETLADEAERVERQTDLSPAESRARIKTAIEHDYTLPAQAVGEGVRVQG